MTHLGISWNVTFNQSIKSNALDALVAPPFWRQAAATFWWRPFYHAARVAGRARAAPYRNQAMGDDGTTLTYPLFTVRKTV